MTAGLAFGVTAVVLAVIGLGAYLFFIHHRDRLLDAARATARLQSDLIRAALEHQMMENDRTLIREMLRTFAKDPSIRQVLVLDRTGRPQHASRPIPPGTTFGLDEPTCRVCHAYDPVRRESAVLETEGGTVLRSVVPIENRPACHACHDPHNRINGVLIVDMATGARADELAGDLRWMTIGGGLLALCLLAAIAVVMRIVVHRRLNRFEENARAIALGDLRRRVPVAGNDTLSWLGREFNDMADTAERLLVDLRGQQQRLETVINSVDDGIVVLDRDLRVVAANDAFLQRLNRDRGAVVGRTCREVAAGLCASADCPGLSCFDSAERHTSIVARSGPDGHTRHEEVRSSPVRGPGGEVAFAVEVWRDITGRRAEEARMAEAHRLASLGMLASGFSHELNTPLASVLTCVEGILRTVEGKEGAGSPGAAAVADSAHIAREQLLRCRAVTQHFLRMS
ncbi:MAG: PAS domain-containing protein, partial [Deltaproteobacteria bacterium]|nr:PAS domain-containing protein [Deltaproteobacteria bacterium]